MCSFKWINKVIKRERGEFNDPKPLWSAACESEQTNSTSDKSLQLKPRGLQDARCAVTSHHRPHRSLELSKVSRSHDCSCPLSPRLSRWPSGKEWNTVKSWEKLNNISFLSKFWIELKNWRKKTNNEPQVIHTWLQSF